MLDKGHVGKWIEENVGSMDYPAAYLGNESGLIEKDWESCYPRVCVVGGSGYFHLAGNIAVPLVTQLVNEETTALAHRAYFMNSKREYNLFVKNGMPIFGLESRRPIWEYDLIGFSCSFPGTDLNCMQMLRMSGMEIDCRDRKESDPIVLRGGATFSQVDSFVYAYDLILIGEGEEAALKLVDYFKKYRKTMSKKNFILKVARELTGFYAPAFTKELYTEGGEVAGWEATDGAPVKVKRTWMQDVNKGYVYSNQILNYVEPGMASGNVLVSRGCATLCGFCNEAFCNAPYRDLTLDKAFYHLERARKTSGAANALVSAFCSSTYSARKQLVAKLLEEGCSELSFISQRVDETAEDPNFIFLTGIAGNHTVSLGIESASERGRRRVNKHATEEQIFKAYENFMRAGYTKIKGFMIASLPGETEEDVRDLMRWAPKLVELKHKLGVKTELVFSFTPLSITGHTPMQWYPATIKERTLTELFEWVRTQPEITIRLGAAKGFEITHLTQLMFMADRRLWPVWKELVEKDYIFFSSMNKEYFEWMENRINGLGLPFNYWFREKGKEEVLPWDFIDVGITKEALWDRKMKAEAWEMVPKCTEKCSSCGNCGKEDLKQRKDLLAVKDPDIDLGALKLKEEKVLLRARFRIRIEGNNRFIDNDIFKHVMRRAAYLKEVPFHRTKVFLASDAIKTKNWVEGVDYIDLGLLAVPNASPEELSKLLQEEVHLFKIEGAKYYSPDLSLIRNSVDKAIYEVIIDRSMSEIRDNIARFNQLPPAETRPQEFKDRAEESAWMARNPGVLKITFEGYSGNQSEYYDLREWVAALGIHPETGRVWLVQGKNLSPLLVAKQIFGFGCTVLKSLVVKREDFLLESQKTLFSKKCSCGAVLDKNLFDMVVADKCFSCYLKG